jgi:hypothetical protein
VRSTHSYLHFLPFLKKKKKKTIAAYLGLSERVLTAKTHWQQLDMTTADLLEVGLWYLTEQRNVFIYCPSRISELWEAGNSIHVIDGVCWELWVYSRKEEKGRGALSPGSKRAIKRGSTSTKKQIKAEIGARHRGS